MEYRVGSILHNAHAGGFERRKKRGGGEGGEVDTAGDDIGDGGGGGGGVYDDALYDDYDESTDDDDDGDGPVGEDGEVVDIEASVFSADLGSGEGSSRRGNTAVDDGGGAVRDD